MEFGSRIYHDDFWHTKDARPCANEGVIGILCSFALITADFANELEASAPTDTVKPVVLATSGVWDLNEIETDYMVESVGLRHCSRSSCFGLLVGLTLFTRKVLAYPSCYFWFSVATSKKSCKVCVGWMSRVVVGDFEVAKLLFIRGEGCVRRG